MIQMVIFDLDGTLVNSLTDLALNVNKGLRAAGLPEHPVERYRSFVGNGRAMLVNTPSTTTTTPPPTRAATLCCMSLPRAAF